MILDCTDVFVEMPTSYHTQSSPFSDYTHHNNAKGLVKKAPDRAVTFVYLACMVDALWINASQKTAGWIYDLLESEDSVIAVRGFELKDNLLGGVTLNIPPFLDGKTPT